MLDLAENTQNTRKNCTQSPAGGGGHHHTTLEIGYGRQRRDRIVYTGYTGYYFIYSLLINRLESTQKKYPEGTQKVHRRFSSPRLTVRVPCLTVRVPRLTVRAPCLTVRAPYDTFGGMDTAKISPIAPIAVLAPRTRPLLPIGARSQATLDVVGLPAVCELVLAGHSQSDIARLLGIPLQAVAAWSCNLQGEEQALYTAALRASAEASLDQALQVAIDVDPTLPGSAQRAKLIIDTLMRRAGMKSI